MNLPEPGWLPDEWGGKTIEVDQCRWGHKARKRTKLYICGARNLPTVPEWREPTHELYGAQTARRLRRGVKPELPKSEREKTPPDFAFWLVKLARGCSTQ
jgi:hypothetical protein